MKRRFLAACLAVALSGVSSAIDLDGDGMSDVWQRKYSVPTGAGAVDGDGDGLTNHQESALGTDPFDWHSRALLEILPSTVPDEIPLRFSSEKGKRYEVLSSYDFATWTRVGAEEIVGTGGPITVIAVRVPQADRAFFRYRLLGDSDADGDSLTAWEEDQLGTIDTNSDSDGDGLSDTTEFQNGTSPTDYFNGATPTLTIVAGNNQIGAPDTFLLNPLVVSVSDATSSYPLTGAPVSFSIGASGGQLQASSSSMPASSLTVFTAANGEAKVYLRLPNEANTSVEVTVLSGSQNHIAQAVITATSNDGTQPPTGSPFGPRNVISVVNADGSEDITWQNNSDSQEPIKISRQISDGSWVVEATVPSGTTSYHSPAP